MKRLIFPIVLALFAGQGAQAACYADYKARKSGPLQLHYGVIELPDNVCGDGAAAAEAVEARISRGGWSLVNVVSIFDEAELDQKRQSAGDYFLRF